MAMNEFLAEVYGTGSDEETEKTAEALLLEELEKVAAEEGIDLNELSDDDIVEILNEVISEDTPVEEEKVAAPAEEPAAEVEDGELSEEGQSKLAEADFLGRTMAHAFYAELSEIGKEAAAAEEVAEVVEDEEKEAMPKALGASRLAKMKAYLKAMAGKSGEHMKKHKGKYMAGAGGAAAGMGAGYMAGKKKKASDEAVVERANEILAAAAEKLETIEKQSSDEEALNEQALELLAQNEYDVERIVGLLTEEE